MTNLGLFDCDTHCYEPRDAFTRYLPSEFADRAILPTRNGKGDEVILVGNRVAVFNSESGLGFDMAYRPGSLKEMLRQMGSGNPDETYEPEPIRPEYLERAPRLEVMARQGVEKTVLYPAGMALAAEHYCDDTEALYANLRSFNRWYDEEWGFDRDGTIYAVGMLSLRDLDSAVIETEALIAAGARVVLIPTGPAYGRSPGDPYFDPVWSRLNEAGVTLALHIMPFWYFDAISPAWGHSSNPAAWHMSAWQWNNIYGERPVEDTLSALIYDNVFGRHPNMRVVVSEHGAEWVPHFLRHMDKSRGMGRNGPWKGGTLSERPSEIFRRHVRVAPYPEDDIPWIVENLGYDDCIVMGSDYPHAEGLAEPADFTKLLDPLPADVQARILRTNADDVFRGHRLTRDVPDETDHERVVGALDDLLTRFSDPRTADRETFLRARYDAGLGWVHFEPGFGGLGVAASWQQVVEDRVGLLGAPAPGSGDFVGMHQAAASINAVGTHEQKARFLPPIFTGEESWCQLFSEPGAGSDLAGLSTMAVRDGEEWVVHGQKVWTSGARGARWAILVARTDPDVPKHRGLTFFVCDMQLAGIEIRPLRQADGAAHFNEVFLDGVRLPDDLRLGDPGQGWAVSLVGLHSEREGVGKVMRSPIDDVMAEWSSPRVPSAIADVQRQRVAGAWIEARLLELSNERSRAALGGVGATPLGSLQKVASAAANQRTSSLLVDLMGPAGQVGFDYGAAHRDDGAVADPSPSMQVIRSRANSIEGGTDEIQRNIIGEQLLGLPGDVRVDKAVPWKEVPALMTDDLVRYEVADGVATVTLHNPDRKNAWSVAMEHQYFASLDDAAADARVCAIVVTGAGSAFCPGMDMAALEQTAAAGGLVRAGRRPMHYALSLPKPMIAAINGACAGIGLIQALYCDLRFAARGACMSTSFTRRGLGAEYGTSWMLPRLIGVERALDLLLSGRTFDAEEAHAMGLVGRLCDPADVLHDAQAYAADLARWSSPRAMAAVRHQVYADLDDDFETSWDRTLGIMQRMNAHADFSEGVASFTERREPVFDPLPAGFGESLRDA